MNSKQILQRKSCGNHEINTVINLIVVLATLYGIIIIITQQVSLVVEAKQVALVPLTAQKVYQLLGKNHNLNAVPEGRIVTQGIAAVTGFTLGLKKAIGAIFLYDIITANITEDIDPNEAQQPVYKTQEICFSSRNARSLYVAEAIAEAYSHFDEQNHDFKPAVRKSAEKRLTKPKRHRGKKINKKRNNSKPKRIKVIRPFTQTEAVSPTTVDLDNTSDVGTQSSLPAATGTADIEETLINNGMNMATTFSTTTSTDNDKMVTCIVLEKPKLKK